ncbi:CpsD/CapB family tyrosine-protein kinase [Bacillus sp. FJAT-49705]|uniref:non-specific protein-tyrosine kinase n=1 Tax=Cytobacillus citreus TaxID=2833586 RepID=A0ABS5NXS4_9BACI|nr:CpsD/CapB family tyrosine-protein kinase [Cytobacillus citreus]MBS4192622.1 CpsD/CapB family tyrosine-protein kinase [Cytobacillus citreus]
MVLKFKKKKKAFANKRKLITSADPKSHISEQYRTIRTNIQFSAVDEDIHSLMITSAGPEEGKSTTAANLAVVFAQQEKRVLLVDADLRKPTVHYTFNLANNLGLTTVLTKQRTLKESLRHTGIEDLSVLTSGPIPPNPAELIGSKAMKQFLQEAKEQFDIVIFDTPPTLAVTDAQILANLCEGILLVMYSAKSGIDEVNKAKELLLKANGKLLGAVLNHKKAQKEDYYYYGG